MYKAPLLSAALSVLVAVGGGVSSPVDAVPAGPVTAARAQATSAAPFVLFGPPRAYAIERRGLVFADLGLRIIAQGQPFEIRATRASYDDPIRAVWRTPAGDRPLPAGAMRDFQGLSRLIRIEIHPVGGGHETHVRPVTCFWDTERVQPDASAESPYPDGCRPGPYSLGSVMGVQAGWASRLSYGSMLRVPPGKYRVHASVSPKYAELFGLSAPEATARILLVVQAGRGHAGGDMVPASPGRGGSPSDRVAARAGSRPTGLRGGPAPSGPMPDLRALPPEGGNLSPDGNLLRFGATVWNAGTSPLVVSGFRDGHANSMAAYQYFFDSTGTQTSYLPVGRMEWDPRPSHRHWHFKDFARYVLLDAHHHEIAVSHKESFCLANTDAVDLTIPDAEWRPENTDLATACGDHSSLSVSEVLAAGWGDTYSQLRAGQAIRVKGLPNGTYYLETIANPTGNLVESDHTNNVAMRRIHLGGRPGHRTLSVSQVGIVDEAIGEELPFRGSS